MKRSEINDSILLARDFFEAFRFHLPKWAFWNLQNWEHTGAEVQAIKDYRMGWDVTDFGSEDFRGAGMVSFLLRNGQIPKTFLADNPDQEPSQARSYSEKIILVQVRQVCPLHYLHSRDIDLLNRGGGDLVVQLHYPDAEDGVDVERRVPVLVNGIVYNIKAGGIVRLVPGDSITIAAGLYRKFWAEKSSCLVGEISSRCDEENDYHFLDETLHRITSIEEDEPCLHLLNYEYPETD